MIGIGASLSPMTSSYSPISKADFSLAKRLWGTSVVKKLQKIKKNSFLIMYPLY